MNAPILARELETDTTRRDLRPCEHSPQPIGCPEKRPTTPIGGRR
jgi:hypothetical protein